MKDIFSFLIILSAHQICLSQINLTIDARQVTQFKLSEITEQSHYMTLKTDNNSPIFNTKVTDKFLFVQKNILEMGAFKGEFMLYQYDLSGKLIRTFGNDKSRFSAFMCDLDNNKLIMIYNDSITVWDMNGRFLKTVRLPERSDDKAPICQVFGFSQNNVWILQQTVQGSSLRCRISSINIENEQQTRTILERNFPHPNQGSYFIPYRAWYSSFGGKSYIGFHDNEIYEVNGLQTRSFIKYTIGNYRVDPLDYARLEKEIIGRFFHMKYGSFDNRKLFWYDIKDKRTWQVQENLSKGGIEDDVFRTGTCDNYLIYGDYLTFIKKSDDLPKEMNIEKDHTVIFIIKLKQ